MKTHRKKFLVRKPNRNYYYLKYTCKNNSNYVFKIDVSLLFN